MSPTWWGVIGTSVAAFALKYIGHSIPSRYLEHRRIVHISALVPIALLSALVAIQTFTDKTKLALDHRALGVGVVIIALLLKAPFPVVVIAAAASSAFVHHFA